MKLTRCKKCKVRVHPEDMDIHEPECKKEVHHHHYSQPYWNPYWYQPVIRDYPMFPGFTYTAGNVTVASGTTDAANSDDERWTTAFAQLGAYSGSTG